MLLNDEVEWAVRIRVGTGVFAGEDHEGPTQVLPVGCVAVGMRMLVAAAAAALTLGSSAHAATPAQGEVSAAQPKVSWSGEAYGQPMKTPWTQTHELCISPFCDSFALNVKEPGALRVYLNAPGSAQYVDVLVTLPDGSTELLAGNDADDFQEIVYRKAAAGTYLFDIWPNEIIGVYDGLYNGDAELCPAPAPFGECFVPEE